MEFDNTTPLCRVCMRVALELVDLQSEMENALELTVLTTFNFCTQLNACQDDELPQQLCTECNQDLLNTFDFIKKAQEADHIFRLKRTVKNEDITEYMVIEVENDKSEENEVISVVYSNDDEEHINDSVLEKQPIDILDENNEDDVAVNACVPNNRAKFSCSQCSKLFDTQEILETHLKQTHFDNQLLCYVCGKICPSRKSLNSHLLKHKGRRTFSCQYCSKKYFTRYSLQCHLVSTHSHEKISKYLCSVCGKEFATKQRLNIHHLTHTGEKNHDCDVCGKKFATSFRLRNHRRTHTGEKPYECKICGVKFAQSNALKCHERIHTGEKPYECKICGKRFNQNTILKTHMTLHTGKTVQCPMCDKKFSRPSCLILHEREHTGEKPYACYKCPNRYKQKSHLDRHLDTHFGIKHKCNVCSKEYSKRSSLRIHMFEHSDEKPFQCPDCTMKFTRKDKYKTHLLKAHNKILVKQEVSEVVKLINDKETTISNNQEVIIEVNSIGDVEKGTNEIQII